jgi:Ran GTPase-activating protein (RanGAP) involved in mRNA processing and transport
MMAAEGEQTMQTRFGMSEAVVRQSAHLNLAWKSLTAADIALIAGILPHCCDLVELDLRHNKLGDAGTVSLAHGLSVSCPSLAVVCVARNNITDRGAAALAKYLSDGHASRSVRQMDLSLNALRSDDALGQALHTNHGLVELDLSSNAICSGEAIARALGHNRTLSRANMLYNRLDLSSAHKLAAAVRTYRARGREITLCGISSDARALSLPRRGMSSSDAILVAVEVEVASHLRFVDLSHNQIGPEGAAALGNALHASSTLPSVSLQCNRLCGVVLAFGDEIGKRDDSGVAALAAALAHGNTLTSLNLAGNALGATAAQSVADAAACAPSGDALRWLHSTHCHPPLQHGRLVITGPSAR